MIRDLLETAFRLRIVRACAALAILLRGWVFRIAGARYRALSDFCWVVRVAAVTPLRRAAWTPIAALLDGARNSGHNPVVDWYLASELARRCATSYTLSGGGPNDLFRDLIVLRPATQGHKGVILLKYARTFEAVIALLDLERILARYTMVLEPCWSGYCDPALLMFYQPAHPVVVQCFTAEDFRFVETLGPPMVPLRLGPADWVDSRTFRQPGTQEKIYDIVMVANWAGHKRHRQLFRALRKIRDRELRVLLVGFPWAGRTAADIRRESRIVKSDRIRIDIMESVPHEELAALLTRCKVFVFLSRKEGDNKSLVEAMFADVPAIVFDRSIGGARGRINPATGVLSSDQELACKITYMLDHYLDFSPRQWAIAHTGSGIATSTIDSALREIAQAAGDTYVTGVVEKTNAPNLAYRNPGDRARFKADYDFVVSCLRRHPAT